MTPTARTLAETVRLSGVGIHTGAPCEIALHPLEPTAPTQLPKRGLPTQIRFHANAHEFPARWNYIVDTTRATVLGDAAARISTVEHLMAALWFTGITHCLIELLRGAEVPILDGSAQPFVEAICAAGTRDIPLPEPRAFPAQSSNEPPVFQVRDGERFLALQLSGSTLFGYIELPPPLGVQAGAFSLAESRAQIAPARTFGFLHEVEALRQRGLALGGSLENALVINETGYYNPARFTDEPLRHKLLDVLGDLYLCGAYLQAFTLVAVKPGHTLNAQLTRQLAQWLWTEA